MTRDAAMTEDELQRYIDGRLDPARAEAVRRALANNPALAAEVEGQIADRAALRNALAGRAAEPVPERLRLPPPATGGMARMAAAAAIFAVGIGLGWGLGRDWGVEHPLPSGIRVAQNESALAQEARVAHAVYAVEVVHPVEVRAEEREHLMAWLSKRLGRKLAVPDLSAHGFELVGGRLLPAGTGPAAQLMYEDASGLRATIYITAMAGDESAFRYSRSAEGVSSLAWLDEGYGCAISAPLDRAQLWPLAEATYEALAL
ncbi:anti-sigma factor [Sinirhodobacter sp. HNIBRBA609]|nr:anti-sigma factor [Sinirhodobacter sp. HNIBRBA609]